VLEVYAMETSSSQLSTEQILSAVSHLSLPELEQVFDHVLALQAERKAAHVSTAESALLARIHQGLPAALRERIACLRARRDDGSIADAEYEELTRLTDRTEALHADRMAALVDFATCRSVSLAALMDQLGIHFPAHV
jgi:hypothetical protein